MGKTSGSARKRTVSQMGQRQACLKFNGKILKIKAIKVLDELSKIPRLTRKLWACVEETQEDQVQSKN